MESSDKMKAVAQMQNYIISHLDEKITLEDLGRAAQYSKYHGRTDF